jgi:transketolase
MDDLKSFRQTDSLTPGHPEYGKTKGVDATAGPLGQGIAQAVGMAIAEKALQAQYVEGKRLFNHYTYCVCGDGCLQEGISQEAISMAGHMRLNKLILIYDANQSTLDGPTTDTMTENVKTRFLASEWNVLEVADGNDMKQVLDALHTPPCPGKPRYIILNTLKGKGVSFMEGQVGWHGKAPNAEQAAQALKELEG